MSQTSDPFGLNEKVVIITGGAGFLGGQHCRACAKSGAAVVVWDINETAINDKVRDLKGSFETPVLGMQVDITQKESVQEGLKKVLDTYGKVDVLINNAAIDPKVNDGLDQAQMRLENYSLENWHREMSVGLTGAFLCAQAVGQEMAKRKSGSIINIASDLSVIAPDQRIYYKDGVAEDLQPVKPVTYSVIKHGLLGLTKYLSTYWAKDGVRVNSLSPGGIFGNEAEDFVKKLTNLIPMGRMANYGEYEAAVIFLASEASVYMTGQNLIIDGGRSVW